MKVVEEKPQKKVKSANSNHPHLSLAVDDCEWAETKGLQTKQCNRDDNHAHAELCFISDALFTHFKSIMVY
jgi:hypothetical protein